MSLQMPPNIYKSQPLTRCEQRPKGKGQASQGLHTKARQPLSWGDSSPSNSELCRSQQGGVPLLFSHPQVLGVPSPQHVWLQAGTPSQVVDGEQSIYQDFTCRWVSRLLHQVEQGSEPRCV